MHWHGQNLKFFSHKAPIGIADNQILFNFFQRKHIFEAKLYENCNFSRLRRQSVPQANIFSYKFWNFQSEIRKVCTFVKKYQIFLACFRVITPSGKLHLSSFRLPQKIFFWLRHWNYSWVKIFLAQCPPPQKSWLRHCRTQGHNQNFTTEGGRHVNFFRFFPGRGGYACKVF